MSLFEYHNRCLTQKSIRQAGGGAASPEHALSPEQASLEGLGLCSLVWSAGQIVSGDNYSLTISKRSIHLENGHLDGPSCFQRHLFWGELVYQAT